jgi:hypothetical protein
MRKVTITDEEKRLAELMVWRIGSRPHAVVQAFREKSEDQRRILAPFVLRRHKEALSGASHFGEDGAEQRYGAHLTSIAFAATATLAELKKFNRWDQSYHVCCAIIDREPPWLDEAATLLLERCESFWRIADIVHCIHGLVLQGLIPPPAHERYALGLAFVFGGYRDWLNEERWYDRSRHDPKSPIVDRLRAGIDGLRPAIWRQFEVEGDDEVNLTNCQTRRESVEGGWSGALKALSEEGLLDRQRLLDASLEALARGFAPHRARWHSQFHELMAPTLDERAARAELYFDLLASPVGPIVSFAIAALSIIGKGGKLDPQLVAARIEPALFSSTSANVKSGMRLLADAVRVRPDLASCAPRILAVVLEHKSMEMQEIAFREIEKYGASLDDEARAAIAERLDIMSPALRLRAEALLFNGEPMAATTCDLADRLSRLRRRAENLSADLRRLASVDAAIAAAESGALDVPAASFAGMDIPRLDPSARIVPIDDFVEFVDAALVAVERPDNVEQVERVLAAALRFSSRRPDHAERILAPLGKSLAKFKRTRFDHSEWGTPRGALQIVLTAWFVGEPQLGFVHKGDPALVSFLRAHAAAHVIRARKSATHLSEPTHRGFWIDPIIAVERSRAIEAQEAPPPLGLADKILTLLRLAPDRRLDALRAARTLGGEWGAALRFALGGDDEAGATEALWAAARDVRQKLVPDRNNTSSQTVAGECGNLSSWRSENIWDVFAWEASSPLSADGSYDERRCFTTQTLRDPRSVWRLEHYSDTFRVGNWARALWPQEPESVFRAARETKCFESEPGVCAVPEGLQLLLDPDVPAGPDALNLICSALGAEHKPTARAGVDAMIAMIDDGRLDGRTLGAAMRAYLRRDCIVAKRWPQHLRSAAESSPIASLVIRRASELALASPAPDPTVRDIYGWIDLLRELCVTTGAPVTDPEARRGLEEHGRSGKAAKSARALLASSSLNAQPPITAALTQALENRVVRAERWENRRR